ncbi:MAG: protein-L-isoaspartate O-methyltransferase family protein [Gammaproteobacteria bacterium]
MNLNESRQVMLQQQLRAGSVMDPRVLHVLQTVPREAFMPPSHRQLAFADAPIPLPCGQFAMSPLLEGLLLQALDIRLTDHVLEVGTGSGYVSACMARLSTQVTTVEIFPELAEAAQDNLQAMDIANCEVLIGDVYELTPPAADVIAVTGSLPVADPRFDAWLNHGGRMFQIIGDGELMQAWRVCRTAESDWQRERLFETAVPPLLNGLQRPKFRF